MLEHTVVSVGPYALNNVTILPNLLINSSWHASPATTTFFNVLKLSGFIAATKLVGKVAKVILFSVIKAGKASPANLRSVVGGITRVLPAPIAARPSQILASNAVDAN